MAFSSLLLSHQRYHHALNLQFAHGKESVVGGVNEIENLHLRLLQVAGSVMPLDRHAAADEFVELAVVLNERPCEVVAR